MEKILLDLKLNQITHTKRFWETITYHLSKKYIQSSAITLTNNKNIVSDDFKLAQTSNNYFESTVGKLGVK